MIVARAVVLAVAHAASAAGAAAAAAATSAAAAAADTGAPLMRRHTSVCVKQARDHLCAVNARCNVKRSGSVFAVVEVSADAKRAWPKPSK
jgi:invasion protein IalB